MSSRHGSRLKLDAEDLEVAGLRGFAVAGDDDDASDTQKVSCACSKVACHVSNSDDEVESSLLRLGQRMPA
jgi:hypothetical protein